jgi:uncharacterized protein (TIGR02231 family)
MRSLILTGLTIAAIWQGAACAQAPITATVLYPGSATIIRSAAVTPGTSQIIVSGLPANFDVQTLQADADPGIRIGQIVAQDAGRSEATNPAEAQLEARIIQLRDQEATLEAQIKAADIVKGYLERFGGSGTDSSDRSHPVIDAKTLSGLIDTVSRGAAAVLTKAQQLGTQKRDIAKQAQALQRDLDRMRSGSRDARTVIVHLAAERAGTVRLSYQVNNAGWRPAYRAGLDSVAGKVELERLATVSQKTGEDWNNVKLTLSTSQPRQSPTAPEPQPWLLGYQPPRPSAADQSKKAAPAPATRAMKLMTEDADSYVAPTFETESTFATEFEVPNRVSLPADGREVLVGLSKQTLAVKQRLRVAPRTEKAAVVTAEAERPAGVWLPGRIQLFRDRNYVGASHWNPQGADTFVLSFGRDELVRVTVDQIQGQTGSTGVFDKRNERRLAEVFGVTNNHKSPVDILVLESSPVSTSDEIKVQASFDPKPTTNAWDQRRGVVAWERTLAPRETAKFSVDYLIEFPKEGSISGLR